jgi:hypothetical protein
VEWRGAEGSATTRELSERMLVEVVVVVGRVTTLVLRLVLSQCLSQLIDFSVELELHTPANKAPDNGLYRFSTGEGPLPLGLTIG